MKLSKGLKNLQPVLLKAGGAIAGNFVAKVIPVGNDRVKSAIVAAGGLLLSSGKGAVAQLGEGMAIGAIANIAKSFGIGADGFIMGTDGFIGDVYPDEPVNGVEDSSGFADGNF